MDILLPTRSGYRPTFFDFRPTCICSIEYEELSSFYSCNQMNIRILRFVFLICHIFADPNQKTFLPFYHLFYVKKWGKMFIIIKLSHWKKAQKLCQYPNISIHSKLHRLNETKKKKEKNLKIIVTYFGCYLNFTQFSILQIYLYGTFCGFLTTLKTSTDGNSIYKGSLVSMNSSL